MLQIVYYFIKKCFGALISVCCCHIIPSSFVFYFFVHHPKPKLGFECAHLHTYYYYLYNNISRQFIVINIPLAGTSGVGIPKYPQTYRGQNGDLYQGKPRACCFPSLLCRSQA